MTTPRIAAFLAFALALSPAAQAQSDPNNIPEPPADHLTRLQPFLGAYEQTMDYAGQEWAGTLDVRPAVKGWYVEWEINTHSGPIDRQLRLLMTWDREAELYRIWRFETQDPLPSGANEGTGRFEGNEFVMEWAMPAPDGEPGTFRNRVRMEGADTLVIVTEGERASGEVRRIGVTTALRRITAQTMDPRPRVIAANEGAGSIGENGFITLIKVGSISTGASELYLGSGIVPPGTETPAHLHEVDEEVLYVLEGEITLTLNNEVHTVGAGGTAFIPPGNWMKVENRSDAPAHVLGILPRGNVERCFRAIYPAEGYYETEADRNADFAFCKTRLSEEPHGEAETPSH